MESRREHADHPGNQEGDGGAVTEFVGVMGRLKAVIEEENDLLARGLPATLLDTTAKKQQLSREYGARADDLVDGAPGQILSDTALQEKLLAATTQLYAMTEENRDLLSKALAATRRRVDNVMDAIRAHDAGSGAVPIKRR